MLIVRQPDLFILEHQYLLEATLIPENLEIQITSIIFLYNNIFILYYAVFFDADNIISHVCSYYVE